MRKNRLENTFFWGMFCIYLFLLLQVVFFSRMESLGVGLRLVNLTPFDSIKDYITVEESTGYRLDVNIWGNILLFLPLGIYVPLIRKKRAFFTTMSLLMGLSVLIEILQYSLMIGSADIDDIILNVFGGLIGWLIYCLLLAISKTPERVKKVMAVLSTVAGVPLILIVSYLFLRN
ncbi:hypothetical protein BAU15_07615 [Enterococcus sp. JM4C]|uniref:VanZ family protein n=1 Tax=Candidatus Enterococcus huntleyi TaxID=1857217 RepID=UPI001379C59B|nr:VanZ family protein [Enterococcus sp. JM4C]KAF1297570.1 hypothetical protein BAU15_07615 [Enterococcus sp. JM4C]